MLNEAAVERVFLARGKHRFTEVIDGLAVIVQEGFELDPFSPALFVFCNRKQDKLQIPPRDRHPCLWLAVTTTFTVRDLNPKACAHAGHTKIIPISFKGGDYLTLTPFGIKL
ncbi:IS66 family insertion sequence element accessory protein TnpB [Alteribacillus bidgolensis]|uniref:IS66 family insertion sequence element accessory protein TnpB n=1 Tax=Alteribacillus bidgolensis TaxID=930129 RepID=UPI000AEEF5F6